MTADGGDWTVHLVIGVDPNEDIYLLDLWLGSVRLLQVELEVQGIVSKARVSPAGRRWGGRPFARGALYLMLQNRIYLGEIVHGKQRYPGEHAPQSGVLVEVADASIPRLPV